VKKLVAIFVIALTLVTGVVGCGGGGTGSGASKK
jgi:hypothetical protein